MSNKLITQCFIAALSLIPPSFQIKNTKDTSNIDRTKIKLNCLSKYNINHFTFPHLQSKSMALIYRLTGS